MEWNFDCRNLSSVVFRFLGTSTGDGNALKEETQESDCTRDGVSTSESCKASDPDVSFWDNPNSLSILLARNLNAWLTLCRCHRDNLSSTSSFSVSHKSSRVSSIIGDSAKLDILQQNVSKLVLKLWTLLPIKLCVINCFFWCWFIHRSRRFPLPTLAEDRTPRVPRAGGRSSLLWIGTLPFCGTSSGTFPLGTSPVVGHRPGTWAITHLLFCNFRC